jgi:hypothetical protein
LRGIQYAWNAANLNREILSVLTIHDWFNTKQR